MFHHIFICGLSDISDQVTSLGAFSLEFEQQGSFIYMSVRFWKKDTICKVTVSRFGRTVPFPNGYFAVVSRFLSAVTTRSNLVCSSGSPADVFQSLDLCKTFSRGIQCPFRLDDVDLTRLMHHQQSVFGRVDFFSVLQHLVISLGGCLHLRWTHNTPELVKVITLCVCCCGFVLPTASDQS